MCKNLLKKKRKVVLVSHIQCLYTSLPSYLGEKTKNVSDLNPNKAIFQHGDKHKGRSQCVCDIPSPLCNVDVSACLRVLPLLFHIIQFIAFISSSISNFLVMTQLSIRFDFQGKVECQFACSSDSFHI